MQVDDSPTDNLATDAAEPLPTRTIPSQSIEPLVTPALPESPAAPGPSAAVAEDAAKICCICGLDISSQKRSRDRAGRYWCLHCNQFDVNADKAANTIHCPDCGRHARPSVMIEQMGVKVCRVCNENYVAELEHRRVRKDAVTANPETGIRNFIRKMIQGIVGLAVAAVVVTLYHFGLLYFHPKPWVPFLIALYPFAAFAVVAAIAIGVQFVRIALRKSARRANYDQRVRLAADHVMALDDDSHAMGISESPEPLRRCVDRAIARVEACAGQGISGAGDIVDALAKKADAVPLIQFLLGRRPDTCDTVARNREIATVSYLQSDMTTASLAVTAILLRLDHDQDAMTRQALICYRNGELEQSKKIFRRVVHLAKEKNSEIDLAAAYSNLGMLHVMLSEFDDATNRYQQAMQIYKRLGREQGQADCLVSLCLIAYRQKKGGEAEQQFRKALAVNKHCNRREGIAICSSMLGVILLEKAVPELKESERLLNSAVKINLELGRAISVATAYGNLGLVNVKRGDLPAARELFIKAQGIYQRINRPKLVAKIQGMLKTVGTISAAKAARRH